MKNKEADVNALFVDIILISYAQAIKRIFLEGNTSFADFIEKFSFTKNDEWEMIQNKNDFVLVLFSDGSKLYMNKWGKSFCF